MNDHSLKKEIIKEIRSVYPELPDQFYGWQLFDRVKLNIAINSKWTKFIYGETCLRYFRTLCESEIKCTCTNRKLSLYTKLT